VVGAGRSRGQQGVHRRLARRSRVRSENLPRGCRIRVVPFVGMVKGGRGSRPVRRSRHVAVPHLLQPAVGR
jgi:hypothetical protein